MVKFSWKEFKKSLGVTVEIEPWTIKHIDEEWVRRSVEYKLGEVVAAQIAAMMAVEIDEKIVKKLAQELLDSYDYKTAIQGVMHERLQAYLKKI